MLPNDELNLHCIGQIGQIERRHVYLGQLKPINIENDFVKIG